MMDHLPITVGTWNKCRESKAVFSNGINRHNPKIIIASFVMITVTTHIVIVNEIMFIITVYIYILYLCVITIDQSIGKNTMTPLPSSQLISAL